MVEASGPEGVLREADARFKRGSDGAVHWILVILVLLVLTYVVWNLILSEEVKNNPAAIVVRMVIRIALVVSNFPIALGHFVRATRTRRVVVWLRRFGKSRMALAPVVVPLGRRAFSWAAACGVLSYPL